MFSRDVPPEEAELGLGLFATEAPGIGGRLRHTAEDFQVVEVSAPAPPAKGPGKYTLATVRATNWETNRLVRMMAGQLRIPERRIFIAGTKDKRAVTVQNIAIRASEDDVRSIELADIEVLATRRVDRAPKIGELSGNHFQVRIRDMDVDADEALERARNIVASILAQRGFPNFFGPQRFGTARPITHLVGRALVHGDAAEAVWTYVALPLERDQGTMAAFRREHWQRRDAGAALAELPQRADFERLLLEHLAKHPDDAVGALDQLPRTLGRMLVAAYQSLLFNRALTARAHEAHPREPQEGDLLLAARPDGLPDPRSVVPVTAANLERCRLSVGMGDGYTSGALPGHDTPKASGLQGRIEAAVLQEEGVTAEHWTVPFAPQFASHGTRRALWCPLDACDVEPGHDAVGDHIELRFFLPKGSYATCLLREVMKAPLRSYA